jgi:TRAP-type C4-dicarboxylate transport system substrate-binding protein
MVPVFKLHEVCSDIIDTSMFCFGNGVFMNKKAYEKLPANAKAVLDSNVEKYSLMQTGGFTKMNEIGRKMFIEHGGRIHTLSQSDSATLRQRVKPIIAKWVNDTEARGLPAKKTLDALYNILKELGVEVPFEK